MQSSIDEGTGGETARMEAEGMEGMEGAEGGEDPKEEGTSWFINQLNGILKLLSPSSSHIAFVIHPSGDLSRTEAVIPAPMNTPCCRKAESFYKMYLLSLWLSPCQICP